MLRSLISRLRSRDEHQLALTFDVAPRNAAQLLDRFRALGLTRFTECRLTRNRNVMVSFRANELRVHEGYLDAPEDVLLAIVTFVEGRTRAERLRAKRKLLAHPIEVTAPRRQRERTHPDDAKVSAQLTEWHARYNAGHFGGSLRPIEVRVSRRMRARLGHYIPATGGDAAEIAISRRHLRRHGWQEALETLLHEMVHQWQDEQGHPIDHGRRFRAKAREVGISPFARRIVAA